jgi:hypothetical protein
MLYTKRCIGTVAYLGGVPSVFEEFCWSFANLVQFNAESLCRPGEFVHYERSRYSFHAGARNELVDKFRGDWLLQLDTDHTFEPDLLYRMLHRMEQYQVDVVTGLYCKRGAPHEPVIFLHHPSGYYAHVADWEGSTPFLVDAAGGGCLLVKRSVFDRIRDELHIAPFAISPPLTEDLSFFERLRKLKIPVLCDPRIEARHLNVAPVGLRDYDRTAQEALDPDELPELSAVI